MNTKSIQPGLTTKPGAQRASARLVIETWENLLHTFAQAGRADKCHELAERMMQKARENPEDYGRWKRVKVSVSQEAAHHAS